METNVKDGIVFSFSLVFSCFLLHLFLPGGKGFKGYAKDAKGKALIYNLNGIYVWLVYIFIVYYNPWVLTVLYQQYYVCLGLSCVFGLLLSFYFYWIVGKFPKEYHVCAPKLLSDSAKEKKRSQWNIFYFGYELNPRFFYSIDRNGWDLKMFLYLYGAIYLQLIILSFAYHQKQILGGTVTDAMLLFVLEFSYFILDYLYNEDVHSFTYDFVDENAGSFKLIWGCMCFYPFFYSIGTIPVAATVTAEEHPSTYQLLISLFVFTLGTILSRGANNQKYYFKIDNSATHFWKIIPQRSIKGKVLCSGFWGLSRHINYLGELLYATGLALCSPLNFSISWISWLYVIYYLLLLIPRERDDDERCLKKYGKLWEEYRLQTPYRIIPFIY